MSRYTFYLPTHLSAVNACRVVRSTREVVALVYSSSPSLRPTPQLLWQVLIVLSTCSLTTFDSSATVCTSSCTSSRCLNSCSPFCHLKPTSLANLFARNLYRVTEQIWLNSPVIDVLRHVRPLLLTSMRSDRRLPFLPDDARLSVGLVIGCPLVSKLDDRLVPIFCHVALPVLDTCTTLQGVFAPRCVFRHNLAAVVHLMHTPILRIYCCLLNNLLFLNVGPLFVCFVCCNIITTLCTVGFLPVRWYPSLLVDIPCASTVYTSSYISTFTQICCSFSIPALFTHERCNGNTHRLLHFNNLIDGLLLASRRFPVESTSLSKPCVARQIKFSSFFVSMRSIFHRKSSFPHNLRPCTSSKCPAT